MKPNDLSQFIKVLQNPFSLGNPFSKNSEHDSLSDIYPNLSLYFPFTKTVRCSI
jgi:hypothetical protein